MEKLFYLVAIITITSCKYAPDSSVINGTTSNFSDDTVVLHIDKSFKLELGDEAFDFELLDIEGKKVSLSDFNGKYVYWNFGQVVVDRADWKTPTS